MCFKPNNSYHFIRSLYVLFSERLMSFPQFRKLNSYSLPLFQTYFKTCNRKLHLTATLTIYLYILHTLYTVVFCFVFCFLFLFVCVCVGGVCVCGVCGGACGGVWVWVCVCVCFMIKALVELKNIFFLKFLFE